MAKFILIRHAEPRYDEVDARGYFGMGHDLGRLTKAGELQAEERGQDKSLLGADIIIASPYTRALQTAATISRITGIPLTVENDLHEWMPDTTHKFQIDDFSKLYYEYRDSKGVRTKDTIYNWESYEALKNRLYGVLDKYKHLNKVIVVCHGLIMSTTGDFDDLFDFVEKREVELV